jgi:hypothetical protein
MQKRHPLRPIKVYEMRSTIIPIKNENIGDTL